MTAELAIAGLAFLITGIALILCVLWFSILLVVSVYQTTAATWRFFSGLFKGADDGETRPGADADGA